MKGIIMSSDNSSSSPRLDNCGDIEGGQRLRPAHHRGLRRQDRYPGPQPARHLVLSLLSATEPLPLYAGDALWHPCESHESGGAMCRLSLILCGASAEDGRGGQ